MALAGQSSLLMSMGRAAEAGLVAQRMLALARSLGDRNAEGSALNTLTLHEPDLAAQLALYRQARAAFEAGGSLQGLAIIDANLGLTCLELGLYRRSLRITRIAAEHQVRTGNKTSLINAVQNLAEGHYRLGDLPALRAEADRAASLATQLGVPYWQAAVEQLRGQAAWLEDRPAEAARLYERAVRRVGRSSDAFAVTFLSDATRAHLACGQPERALTASQRATALHRKLNLAMLDGMDPPALWWWHNRALAANGRHAEASAALTQAWQLLLTRIQTLGDEGLRRSVLNKRADNRALVLGWLAHARRHGLPAAEREAHLAGPSNLREPFERLVDTGLRLNELRKADELAEFLVDEATELSGAERVLLVFEGADTGLQVAGSLLPQGEDVATLLQAITPWLDEARQTRAVGLRHGPDGAEPIDQRSCLVAPLLAQGEVIGYLYADIGGAFGRFHDTDRQLLGMLGGVIADSAKLEATLKEGIKALEKKDKNFPKTTFDVAKHKDINFHVFTTE
ncbi:MAG: GAF domain-containing protein, partial [Pseudomonadota bacterium]